MQLYAKHIAEMLHIYSLTIRHHSNADKIYTYIEYHCHYYIWYGDISWGITYEYKILKFVDILL